MIAGAVIAGLIGLKFVTDDFLLAGGDAMKYVLLLLAAIIVWQNQGLLKTWGRALVKWW